jgi:hypothetical protein
MACTCFVCNQNFAELNVPVKCDSCDFQAHNKFSELTAGEKKCLSLKKSHFERLLSVMRKRFTRYFRIKAVGKSIVS